MTGTLRLVTGALALGLIAAATAPLRAQDPTLDDVKKEVMRRAEVSGPFVGILREDAERIVQALKSLDPDEWAGLWCKAGLGYEAKADELAKQGGDRKQIGDLYFLAFNNCRVGRYPTASTPGRKEAYRNSLRTFRKAAQYFDLPLEIVEIPFDGKTLVGYLQIPKGVTRPPIVMHWGGVDGWKEDRQGTSRVLHRLGLATLVIDMPGTGESPVRYVDAAAVRTLSAFIDHLVGRQDVDGSRIGVWGGSFGAYWAAKLAYVEAARLKGAVFQGGNAHYGFQEKWLRPALTQTASTYLFGPSSLLEARSQAMGVKSLDEFLKIAPSLSLKDQGLLDKPSAPILCVNGKLDDQAPVEDIYLLAEHGRPKEVRIYPEGGHMGRTPGMEPSEITNLITGWLKLRLGQ